MSNKSQTVFAVCFGLLLAVVVTVTLLFADKLPHARIFGAIMIGILFSSKQLKYQIKTRFCIRLVICRSSF